MSEERLRERLYDLAGQVAVVDLRDRAVRTSRRRSAARRSVAAGVAVLAVAGGSVVAVAQLSDRSQVPTPSSSASPSAAPAPTGTADPAPSTLSGTLYHLQSRAVHALRNGVDTVVATYPASHDGCAGNSTVVSPDGRWVAWVGAADTSGPPYVVGTASGPTRRQLLTNVLCLGSNAIAWIGSTTVAVTRLVNGRSQVVHVDAATGRSSPVANVPYPPVWSVDAAFVAMKTATGGRVEPVNSVTGSAHDFVYTPPADEASHYDGWDVRGVSVDGRYVAVGWLGTDPGRKLESIAVVNVIDSSVVKLPVASFRSVHFLADGHVLVQTEAGVVLLDAAFRELDQIAVPRGLALLRYVP